MLMILTRRGLLEAAWRRWGNHRGCYRRVCIVCGIVFYAGRPQATYCRAACRQRAYRRRQKVRR
ncbi:MAG: hypothetical protein GXY74_11405 [Phycisphaerae bacterium]|nr:hypothetical protein [Phycisphaerae bacterium]